MGFQALLKLQEVLPQHPRTLQAQVEPQVGRPPRRLVVQPLVPPPWRQPLALPYGRLALHGLAPMLARSSPPPAFEPNLRYSLVYRVLGAFLRNDETFAALAPQHEHQRLQQLLEPFR